MKTTPPHLYQPGALCGHIPHCMLRLPKRHTSHGAGCNASPCSVAVSLMGEIISQPMEVGNG